MEEKEKEKGDKGASEKNPLDRFKIKNFLGEVKRRAGLDKPEVEEKVYVPSTAMNHGFEVSDYDEVKFLMACVWGSGVRR